MPLKFAHTTPEAYRYPLLIGSLLGTIDQHAGQQIVSGERHLRYADLPDRIARLAAVLAQAGVGPGTTVAVMDWDSHRYLEAYFAIPMMGAVLQTVNVRLSPSQIAYTLRDTGAAVLLYHHDFAPLVDGIVADLPAVARTIRLTDTAGDDPYEALLAAVPAPFAFEEFDENAVATTFHTTGTTGDPKRVEFSHRQIVLHTLALATALANQPAAQRFGAGDVYMPMTPMFHVHAWGIPYVATMLGVKQVYPHRYDPARLIALQREHGVTFSHCVPTILQMLLAALDGQPPVARWTMLIGGSALPPALVERATRKGIAASAGYGMSETGPVLTIARSTGAEAAGDVTRAGFAIPLVRLAIAPEGDELVARAPWLTQAYGDKDAESRALWQGGWLHTQDVAARDADGAYRIVDRLKDVIKTGGEWLSSATLEACAMEHDAVAEAAIVGTPDDRWGERPVAVVVPTDVGGDFPVDAFKAHLATHVAAGRLSRYAIPERVVVVRELPRTSVGKIDKKRIRAELPPA